MIHYNLIKLHSLDLPKRCVFLSRSKFLQYLPAVQPQPISS